MIQTSAESLFEAALQAQRAGQAALALGLLQQAAARAPEQASYQFELGRALLAAGSPAALGQLGRAAELAPGDPDVLVAHARALREAGQAAPAIVRFEAARALAPARSDIPRALAELYYRHGPLELALARYDEALRLRPTLRQSLRLGVAEPPAQRPVETRLGLADLRQHQLQDDAALQQALAARELHVIDDFLDDPVAYRRDALALPYEALQYRGQNYPGVQTEGRECPQIMQRIAGLLGRRVKTISPDNGAFRLSVADSLARSDIHVDYAGDDAITTYAGVLYLNPPDQCSGGTTFWRHAQTQWEHRPSAGQVAAAGYADYREFERRWLPRDQPRKFGDLLARRGDWQPVFELPMAWNRLLVYQGNWFHSISALFGSTPEDGRLAQLFFFELG